MHGCMQDLALEAVQKVMVKQEGTDPEIDIKKYAKVEKLPGGSLDDCRYSRLVSGLHGMHTIGTAAFLRTV